MGDKRGNRQRQTDTRKTQRAPSLARNAWEIEALVDDVNHLNVFVPVPAAICAVGIQGRVTHNPFDIHLVEVMLPELGSEPISEVLWPESCDVLTRLG